MKKQKKKTGFNQNFKNINFKFPLNLAASKPMVGWVVTWVFALPHLIHITVITDNGKITLFCAALLAFYLRWYRLRSYLPFAFYSCS